MKKITVVTACTLGLMAVGVASAATHVKRASVQSTDSVILYKAKESKDVVTTLSPNTQLVPIFQQGNWVKVGDPRNGQVGWINLTQYQKARAAFEQPVIQTTYINVTSNDKGKPVINVVAYKNGKALPKAQAMALYKKMRAQQQRQYQQMQRFSVNMQRMMDQNFIHAQQAFDSAWMNPFWVQPMVVMPENGVAKKVEKK